MDRDGDITKRILFLVVAKTPRPRCGVSRREQQVPASDLYVEATRP